MASKLEVELTTLMDAVQQDIKTKGITNDDPRLERIGDILSLMQVFHWEDYKRIVITKFKIPPENFK